VTGFFAMGGYAWYVWMSYGVTALVVALEIAQVRARRARSRSEALLAEPETTITTRSALDPGSLA
jgi:heme exporter protein CcmD